jgi:hypothetical protein
MIGAQEGQGTDLNTDLLFKVNKISDRALPFSLGWPFSTFASHYLFRYSSREHDHNPSLEAPKPLSFPCDVTLYMIIIFGMTQKAIPCCKWVH